MRLFFESPHLNPKGRYPPNTCHTSHKCLHDCGLARVLKLKTCRRPRGGCTTRGALSRGNSRCKHNERKLDAFKMIMMWACALIGLRVKPPPQADQRHEATIHALYSVAKGAFKLMGNATWRHTYKKERPNFEMAIAREQHPLKKTPR